MRNSAKECKQRAFKKSMPTTEWQKYKAKQRRYQEEKPRTHSQTTEGRKEYRYMARVRKAEAMRKLFVENLENYPCHSAT